MKWTIKNIVSKHYCKIKIVPSVVVFCIGHYLEWIDIKIIRVDFLENKVNIYDSNRKLYTTLPWLITPALLKI